jgi:disulfide bond formation protein DsbB
VLGTLATAGVATVVGLAVLAVAAPERLRPVRAALTGLGPAFGGAVAVVAMLGSLWFSEGAHFPPCELCWYQRIAMYPLAVLLPIAALRGDRGFRPYALVLVALGTAISVWHNVIETFPSLDGGSCDPTNPCTLRWVEGLGFWTIPRLALATFVLIAAALLLDPAHRRPPEHP